MVIYLERYTGSLNTVESFFFLGLMFVDYQKIVCSWGSDFTDLLHYNARQFISLLNFCGDVNSWLRGTHEIHENWTPMNNDYSPVVASTLIVISDDLLGWSEWFFVYFVNLATCFSFFFFYIFSLYIL